MAVKNNLFLLLLIVVVNCSYLIDAQSFNFYAGTPWNYGCVYRSVFRFEWGSLGDITFASKNGTLPLEKFLSRDSETDDIYVNAIVTPSSRPPLIITFKNQVIQNITNMENCVATPMITESKVVTKDIQFMFETVKDDKYEITIENSNPVNYTIQHDTQGFALPISISVPYSVYNHKIYIKKLPDGPYYNSRISYSNPLITSQDCKRGYNATTKSTTLNCKFTGTNLFKTKYIGGVLVDNPTVSLTSIQASFASQLELNRSISLDNTYFLDNLVPVPTGAYYRPVFTVNQTTFEIIESRVNIKGTFLDAVQLNTIEMINNQAKVSLDCRYSYAATEVEGFAEYIECTIPQIEVYQDANIVLTSSYSSQVIRLTNNTPQPSSSPSFKASMVTPFLLLIITIMFYFK